MKFSGREFFAKHSEYLAKNDIDGLMREHYHPDAEMITFEFILKGTDAIANYLKVDNPKKAGAILGFEMLEFAESDDTIIFTAIVKSEKLGTFVARDSFYVKDGKVLKHITLTIPPDKDLKIYETMINDQFALKK